MLRKENNNVSRTQMVCLSFLPVLELNYEYVAFLCHRANFRVKFEALMEGTPYFLPMQELYNGCVMKVTGALILPAGGFLSLSMCQGCPLVSIMPIYKADA